MELRMTRCLWLCLLVCASFFGAVACSTVARAQDEPAKAAPADAPQSDAPQGAAQDVLASEQAQVAQRFKRLEELLLKSSEIEASSNPSRAALLQQAAQLGKQAQLAEMLARAAKSLDQKQYSQAVEDQKVSRESLKRLLELLQSENRQDRVREERDQVRRWIEETDRLLRLQSSLRGRTEGGQKTEKAASDQAKLAEKAGQIADELDGDQSKKEGEKEAAESSEKEAQPKPSESKPGESKPSESKPSESKSGDSSEQNGKEGPKSGDQSDKEAQGKPEKNEAGDKQAGDEKPEPDDKSKEGEPKDGQSKDGEKPSKDSEKEGSEKQGSESGKPSSKESDSQEPGSEQSKDKQNGKPSESKPSQSQQGESQQGESQQSGEQQSGEQGEKQQPQSPTQKAAQRIKQAQQRMKEAQEKLDDAEREGAVEKQRAAEQELQAAMEQLEEILRQLREEEIERSLAALESRLRAMLQAQNKVLEETERLQEIGGDAADRQVAIRASNLSVEERKILAEGQRALLLLREEGTSAAFPEAMSQVLIDVQTVVDRLAQADAGKLTVSIEKEIVSSLEEMIEALVAVQKEQKKRKEQKQSPGQQQQGQQGEQPLVDKLAELRLIRTLQLRVNKRTQGLAEMLKDPDDVVGQAEADDVNDQLRNLAERQASIQEVTRDIVVGKTK